MMRLRQGTTAVGLLLLLLLQVGTIKGQRPILRRQSTSFPEQTTQKENRPRRRTATSAAAAQQLSLPNKLDDDPTTNIVELDLWAANNVCSRAQTVLSLDLIRGDNNLATVDQGVVHDCVRTAYPGLWYAFEGTGQVLKAWLVREDNHTEIAVFQKGSSANSSDGGSCDSLQCADATVPYQTTTNSAKGTDTGWMTYWGTTAGELYYLYVYGMGSFQMILTEQKRPENDTPMGAIELQIGDSFEGSTAYASVDNGDENIVPCDNNDNHDDEMDDTTAPGVWFSVTGTGSPLQAHLKTSVEGTASQVSIYSNSFDCEEQVEHNEYFDPDTPIWYPVSSAAVWDSVQGVTYYIMVHGHEEPGQYESGNFELTILRQKRPENDHCSFASVLQVGTTIMSSTSFAKMDDHMELCNHQGSSTGEKPTAPGVWYVVTGIGGPHQVFITSAYSSDVTVYTGEHCGVLTCVDGSNNPSHVLTDSDASLSTVITWDAKMEDTYYIYVHGKDSFVGSFGLSLSETSKPSQEATGTTTTNEGILYTVETAASLSFGFFPGTTVQAPSDEEVAALMYQTSKFFSEILRQTFADDFVRSADDFVSFETKILNVTFDKDSVLPVVASFTAKATFMAADAAPSSGSLFNLMAEANFQDFIRSYAWQSAPVGANVFFQTLRVEFGKSKNGTAETSLAQSDKTQEEAVQRVDAKTKMLFSFFGDVELRAPTDVEVGGLVKQAKAFYTKVLQNQFDDFVRLGVRSTGREFTAGAQMPIALSLDMHAYFASPSNSTSDLPTSAEVLKTMQDVKLADLADFIQNYVWESDPFSTSIFYETRHVSLASAGSGVSTTPAPTSVAPSAVGEPSKVTVQVALYLSFHDTTTVTLREPKEQEVDGLLNQTERFFKEIFQNELPEASGFDELHLVTTSVEYNDMSTFPVVVYMKVEVSLREDSSKDLSTTQVLALLETASMSDYVEFYAWFSEPVGSIFFATDQAVLEPYDPVAAGKSVPSTSAAGNITSSQGAATGDDDTLLPVETDIVAKFMFFRGNNRNYRVATQKELDALTVQTKMYFTKVLQKTYDDVVRLDLNLVTAGFENNNEASVVSWQASALFYVSGGTGATRTPEHLLSVLTSSDVEEYLHKYVWSAEPMGSNLFFDASAVQFETFADMEGTSNTVEGSTLSSTPAPATTPPAAANELVVRASMLYGFLQDQEITSTPNPNEQESILYQTSLFFNKLFRQQFGTSFKKANTSIKDVTLIEGDALPIVVSFEIIAIFDQDDDSVVPSAQALYQVMEDANFESYIEFYVWNTDSSANSMFYDTQQVVFQATVGGGR